MPVGYSEAAGQRSAEPGASQGSENGCVQAGEELRARGSLELTGGRSRNAAG